MGWVLFFGVATFLAGLVVAAHPGGSLTVIAVFVGIEFVVGGIYRLVLSFTGEGEGHRVFLVLIGTLGLVVGSYLIRHLDITIAIMSVVIGIFWIIQGVMEFLAGASAPRQLPARRWNMFIGIVGALAGVVVLSWPIDSLVTLAWVLGLWLIIYGLLQIVASFQLRKLATA
jgi:uncharacterized membrane protein HdeD (DUF308 family)